MKPVIKKIFYPSIALLLTGVVSCTKLEPELGGAQSEAEIEEGGAPAAPSLTQVYNQLNQLISQENEFALQEHSTDEIMGPTRGTDWDDFGTWRKLHLHTWDGAHNQLQTTWNGINGALFQTTLLAESSSAATQEKAEAQFLRAYFAYLSCDLFGVVQHRPATAAAAVIPDVYTRAEAADYIISEAEAALTNLPTYNHDNRNMATKEAAKFLLAKAYLNKAVYKQDPASPAGPFTFAAADMNKVIEYCNDIISNPLFAVNDNYWDNFKWDNGSKSTENIFVRQNSQGINVVYYSAMGNHYSMPPDGWNGFTTLSDFYNAFGDDDMRKKYDLPGFTELTGRPAGFLIGQQKGPEQKRIGNAIVNLTDRSGSPLVFTEDVSLFFSTESKGIRTNKYPLDPSTMNDGGWASQNEYVFFRFSDVLMMKAEAILRGGTDPMGESAAELVNEIRAKRGIAALGSVDLDALLAERGRELYLEGWRRNDLVRFGKFNQPVQERSETSDPTRVVFPIPNIALSSNPNLQQNVGY